MMHRLDKDTNLFYAIRLQKEHCLIRWEQKNLIRFTPNEIRETILDEQDFSKLLTLSVKTCIWSF